MFLCPYCKSITEHSLIRQGVYCCETCSSEKIPFDLSSDTGRNLDGVNLSGRFFYKRNTYLIKRLTILGICREKDVLEIETVFNKIQTIFDIERKECEARRDEVPIEYEEAKPSEGRAHERSERSEEEKENPEKKHRHNLLPLNYLISKIIEYKHLNIAYHNAPKSKKTLAGYLEVWDDLIKKI